MIKHVVQTVKFSVNKRKKIVTMSKSSSSTKKACEQYSQTQISNLPQSNEILNKLDTLKEATRRKNEQIEEQFQELQDRLDGSSQYLLKIKKNIENLKSSRLPTDHCTPQIEDDFDTDSISGRIDEIKTKIDHLQVRTKAHTDKYQHLTENYKLAFETVLEQLEHLENTD